MLNPYSGIDWEACVQIKSVSHLHMYSVESMTAEERLADIASMGYEHIPLSQYTPSIPNYPLSDFFDTVPEGVISSPNSEKTKVTTYIAGRGNIVAGHFNALGSFTAGYGNTPSETTGDWHDVFDAVFDGLQYADGGGITINHPIWPTDRVNFYKKFLDYDDRVLGIEVYNNMDDYDNEVTDYYKFYVQLWDGLLSTGRRCYGFGAIDHPMDEYYPIYGANMLIVPEKDEHECLKAYRNGRFYVIKKDTGLRFTDIHVFGGSLFCTLNRSANITFITDKGKVRTVTGSSAQYAFKDKDIYVRIEVHEADHDSVMFAQPVMLKNVDDVRRMKNAERRKKTMMVL